MKRVEPLKVIFYQTAQGNKPVKDFFDALTRDDKKAVGTDLAAVQMGFPMGEPLVKPVPPAAGLWELRSTLSQGICRIYFTQYQEYLFLLHAIIKKSRKIPRNEKETAMRRLDDLTRRLKKR